MPNPVINQGASGTVPNSFNSGDPNEAAGYWQIKNPSGTVIATGTAPNSWSVSNISTAQGSSFGSVSVTVPMAAAAGIGYTAQYWVSASGGGALGYDGPFDVALAIYPGPIASAEAVPGPSLALTATAPSIFAFWAATDNCADTVALSWVVSGATTVSIAGSDGSSWAMLGVSGTVYAHPAIGTVTYTLSATNAAGTVTATAQATLFAAITPSVATCAVLWFAGGAAFVPGVYRVQYVRGAYSPSAGIQGNPAVAGDTANFTRPDAGFTVNGHGPHANTGSPLAGFFVTDGYASSAAPGDAIAYATQADCERANVGASALWFHGGQRPIGVQLADVSAGDATGSPTPTFCLSGPVPFVTAQAAPVLIMAGQVARIGFAASGCTSVSCDQGIGSLPAQGGEFQVAPTVTTIYAITGTNGLMTATATVTVNVCSPTTPQGLTATPECSGQVTLNWT